jgi:glycosyltransferase involved in cell wall biosynthesis
MQENLDYPDKKRGKVFISVIITAFNRKTYVEQAMKSALNQTLSKDLYEIFLVKNYVDESIDEFAEKNGIIIVNSDEPNYGNRILSVLKFMNGEIICFLEDDDLYNKSHLKYIYDSFVLHQKLGFIKGNFITFSNVNTPYTAVWKPIKKVYIIDPEHIKTKNLIFIESRGINAVISASAIRKDLLALALANASSFYLFDYYLPFYVIASGFQVMASNYIISKYRVSDSWTHIITDNREIFLQRKIDLLERTVRDYTAMINFLNSNYKFRRALSYNRTKMQIELTLLRNESSKISDITNYIVCSISELNYKRMILLVLYFSLKLLKIQKLKTIYFKYIGVDKQ